MSLTHRQKLLLSYLVFAIAGVASLAFAATTYAATTDLYVAPTGSDSNSGSQSAPFQTIAAASQHAVPGTTIHVEPGRYAGGFITTVSGTASAHITYVSDVPYGAKIVGGGPASDAAGWWNKGDYVDITGFEIDGSGSQATSWRNGFYGSGSHDTFQNGKVHDILTDSTAYANAAVNGAGGAAVEMDNYSGAVDGSIIGNIVYNVGPSGQTSSLVHGIYQIESGEVANNVVYNVVGNGVVTWHGAKNIQIVNNTIDNARDGGIVVGSGDSGSSSTTGDYITVANNIVTNSNWGISESGTTGVHNQYVNNLLYRNSTWEIHLQHGLTDVGTIISDPKFVNPTAGDYHLQSGSPAIGAGVVAFAPSTDLSGALRSTTPSIGAYEGTFVTIGSGGSSSTGSLSTGTTTVSVGDPATGTTTPTTPPKKKKHRHRRR